MDLRTDIKKDACLEEFGLCSIFVNCSRFISQHNLEGWGGVYDHLTSSQIFNFDNEYDLHMSFKNYEASGYGYNLEWELFHILGEVGAKLKMSIEGITLSFSR